MVDLLITRGVFSFSHSTTYIIERLLMGFKMDIGVIGPKTRPVTRVSFELIII